MRRPKSILLCVLGVLSSYTYVSGAYAQSLEDVLAATEAEMGQIYPDEKEVEVIPPDLSSGTILTPKIVSRQDALEEIDMSLFQLEASPHADELAEALRLLAYLEHQVATAPDTPMSMQHQLSGPAELDEMRSK